MRSVDVSFLSRSTVRACGRAAVTGMLCALLAGQPVLAEYPAQKPAPVARVTEIQGQERVLHALNRLTFGPRPGDVAAVQKMGLDAWFEQQLNPSRIDDSALEARLAEYPAMNLPLSELQRKYPGPQALKALEQGRGQLPTDPLQREMVETQLKFYAMQKKNLQGAAATAKVGAAPEMASAAGGGSGEDMNGMAQAATAPADAMAPAKKAKKVQAGMAALESERPAGEQTEPMAAMPDKPIAAADLAAEPLMPAANRRTA